MCNAHIPFLHSSTFFDPLHALKNIRLNIQVTLKQIRSAASRIRTTCSVSNAVCVCQSRKTITTLLSVPNYSQDHCESGSDVEKELRLASVWTLRRIFLEFSLQNMSWLTIKFIASKLYLSISAIVAYAGCCVYVPGGKTGWSLLII